MIAHIRKYFVAGLLTILPLALSIYILVFLFKLVDNILGKYLNAYIKDLIGVYVPGLGLILFFLILFFGLICFSKIKIVQIGFFTLQRLEKIDQFFYSVFFHINFIPAGPEEK